ncbi:GNAT family N-acetyltransferase [Halosimplex aquaticum]|uniref:GNAT family N-acetyltransferase n=1 Tax=Halosimplex aquaticum TaxID=3026162 RepID=A0ABD5XYI2_9EURY|nr:GNAT family N-acetyltransferase [Halosimplex aquaticum]
MARDVTVRPATPDDLSSVLGVLDAGALETDADRVRASIDCGDAFVAVRDGTADSDDGSAGEGVALGALVLDGDEIAAVAVRRRRRGQGIGSALVAAAADRRDRLVAEFDGNVRPFYEGLEFEVMPVDGSERFRGYLDCEGG